MPENKEWQRADGSCIFCDDFGQATVIDNNGSHVVACPHVDDPAHHPTAAAKTPSTN